MNRKTFAPSPIGASDVVNKVQAQLARYRKVTSGHPGATIQEIDRALANSGLKKPEGALFSSVEQDRSAEKPGLQPGDVMVRLNEHAINHSSDLLAQDADLSPGSTSKLEFPRKGGPMALSATIGEMENAALAQNEEAGLPNGRLGLVVQPLDKVEQWQSGVIRGFIVEEVTGPAASAGIQTGDVILLLNGIPISSGKQFHSLIEKAGKTVSLLVQRDDARIFIPVDLD